MKISNIEVSYVDHMGTDISIVNAARVSFDKESEWEFDEYNGDSSLKDSDKRLIAYLAKHKHYSPFNHTFITVRVKAPIFVARQLVKHEYMPWNEVSRRYVDSEPEFYIPEMRMRAENVKQGSADVVVEGWDEEYREYCERCLDMYNRMLKAQIAPEIARTCLPPNVMTEWVWSGTLKAFHKMLDLRLPHYTQKEARIVAEKCRDLILPLFPVSLPALLENN